MDSRLLEYYNRELQFVREMGAEFAEAYPRIAARLGMDGIECADPYVERLIEAFAFLAARVQLKLDARHPDFTQHLLEMVYPQYLAPMPSCAIVELVPAMSESSLKDGVRVARGSTVRAEPMAGEQTSCVFRTSQDVTLWPLSVTEVKYVVGTSSFATPGLKLDPRTRAACRIALRAGAGLQLAELPLDSLTFYFYATADLAARIHEQVFANCVGVVVRPKGSGQSFVLPAGAIRAVGLDDEESLLPAGQARFQGYRLLQEYFAFPERFLFFAVDGLRDAVSRCNSDELELLLLFDRSTADLENMLDASQFRLNCTPVINLFPRALDRVHVSAHETELHVVPELSRPMDFEIYTLDRVVAVGSGGESLTEVQPFYSTHHRDGSHETRTYYTVQRRPRLASAKQRRTGLRTNYLGTECFVSIVDSHDRDITGEIRQLDVQAHCTNRDLPIGLSFGKARLDLTLEGGAPVETVRCLAGPTQPRPSPAFGETAWKLIGQLSLNYLSLTDTDPDKGAEALRQLLGLYADPNDSAGHRQIDGVRSIAHRAVVRRVPCGGPITFGRGLELTLLFDDGAFEGAGVLRLATVLERFFARYVSINSFVETRVRSSTRGDIKQWPARTGSRQII